MVDFSAGTIALSEAHPILTLKNRRLFWPFGQLGWNSVVLLLTLAA